MVDEAEASRAQPTRRLAAIMFTDLVGYSALSHSDEALAIELLEMHRVWVREILPKHGGIEIETVGDAFLIEFAGALAAAECALAIQQRFAEYNAATPEGRRIHLRIGIHLGDVEHKDGKVMGDGVNLASRIHGMAEPGGICVSEQVYHLLRNRKGLVLGSMGRPKLKNISTELELYRLAPATAAPGAATAVPPRERRAPRALAIAAGAMVMLAVLAAVLQLLRPAPAETPSVAVLPFQNLSADPENAFFTDGLHDTVIGHLGRIRNLRVISRTSVMHFRDSDPGVRVIAKELGVAHILEGSVQRTGGRLRIVVQLIDAATDAHLWSQEYERELADVFAIQADIAQQVAEAVHATLTPQEAESLHVIPTRSPEAYDLYLKALLLYRRSAHDPDPAKLREAIGGLDRALQQDPRFALAYALRSGLHDLVAWNGFDSGAPSRKQSEADAAKALELAPQLAESRIAQALVLYHGQRRYDEALEWLEQASVVEPSNAAVQLWIGTIRRRQGHWEAALAAIEGATALDPLNEDYLKAYATTLGLVRRYADADRVYARLAAITDEKAVAAVYRAYNTLSWTGDWGPLELALAGLPPDFDPNCEASEARWDLAVLQRQYDAAVKAISACKPGYIEGAARLPVEYFDAQARWLAGERARARASAARVRDALAHVPDSADGSRSIDDAFIAAMLGDPDAARRAVDRYLSGLPRERDAADFPGRLYEAALLHATIGDTERALDELRQSLDLPGGAAAHEARLQPLLDPLRGDPRFQKLIADHLPKPAPG